MPRCAIEIQNGMIKRNTGPPPERGIEVRVGIHLGDVVEESDGDFSAPFIALSRMLIAPRFDSR
jgi:adenylate cyclase